MGPIDLLLKPVMAATPKEKMSDSPLQKSVFAGVTSAIPVAALKAMGYSFKSLIPSAIIGAISGSMIPSVVNKMVTYKKMKEMEKAKEALRILMSPESYSSNIRPLIEISKHAGFGKVISKATGLIGKGIWGGTKAVGRGLLPVPKTAPIGEKIFGIATKGSAAGLVGYGTMNLVNQAKQKRPPDYTTLLRNNILAGRIHPSELNPADLEKVRKFGFQ